MINGNNDSVAPALKPCSNLAAKWDSYDVPALAAQMADPMSIREAMRKTGRLRSAQSCSGV